MADGEPTIKNYAAFIWSVADLLRGDYRRSEYGRVILPMTVIRRLDCVLEPTKNKVLAVREQYGDRDTLLRSAAGVDFYNTSKHQSNLLYLVLAKICELDLHRARCPTWRWAPSTRS
ncbi:MAG TPA: type I restriction-modification system subunit M N-terminal domain-containing protein [Streptosporangiaceae bacterium]|nr:type I restriction-modification system subunit M N-terminal domain-containing protein [Streptosporangiaceae bacterium]